MKFRLLADDKSLRTGPNTSRPRTRPMETDRVSVPASALETEETSWKKAPRIVSSRLRASHL